MRLARRVPACRRGTYLADRRNQRVLQNATLMLGNPHLTSGVAMADTMLAAVFQEPGHLSVRETNIPRPGSGEVLLALEGTGVCASNLPLWARAPRCQYPVAPGTGGHEGWGLVREVGEGVDRSLVGKRVAA